MNNEETPKEAQIRGIRYVAKQSNGKWQLCQVKGGNEYVEIYTVKRGFTEISHDEFKRLLAIKRAEYTN
jgi:hypothetical protein